MTTKDLTMVPVQLISSEEVLVKPARSMERAELIEVWSLLDIMEKNLIKDRKGELRDEMLNRAENHGEINEKGSFVLELEDGKITRQKRQGKTSIEAALVFAKLGTNPAVLKHVIRNRVVLTEEQLLLLRDLVSDSDSEQKESLMDALDDPKVDINTEAFNGLVAAGVLSEKDVDAVSQEGKITWALTVAKPKTMKPLIAKIKEANAKRKELLND